MGSEINLVNSKDCANVKIIDGELVSFRKFGEEFMHQKGDRGWRNSDTEMFPIIGPTKLNDFYVLTPSGNGVQDQHGMLRELDYTLLESTKSSAVYTKSYIKNTRVKNSKFPDKSTVENVFWPYDFNFIKKFELNEDGLKIQFEIQSEKGMPFMLGYHPAFKISKNSVLYKDTEGQKITTQDVLEAGADAYAVLNTNRISLVVNSSYSIDIVTKAFDNFMLWTEVDTMLCIEPITQYPDLEKQLYSKRNMRLSNGNEIFNVDINPINR